MGTTAADLSASSGGATTGTFAAVHPVPTDEETAAIVAALQLLSAGHAAAAPAPEVASWRFSGRWWTQPIPLRRPRPWT